MYLTKLVKTQGFTNGYHDIYDPAIHGEKRIIYIRYTLSNKVADPSRARFIVFNAMLKLRTNKIASWDVGLRSMVLPEVFPYPDFVMLCTENYDEDKKAIVNKNTKEEIISINVGEFSRLLNLGFEAQNSNIQIDLGKLVENYESLDSSHRDSFIKALIKCGTQLDQNHKPPYDSNIFVSWVGDTISLLLFCLGLENDREVGASLLEMIFRIHCVGQPVRYNFIEHIVQSMQKQLLMMKKGSCKTFRFSSYLCYLLLSKYRAIFETNNLQIVNYKIDEKTRNRTECPIYKWTPKIRMHDNRKNYNHFVDFLLAPMYNEINNTPMPRLSVSCRDSIQLGTQIQLADWFFMEEYTVLRFYGSTVKPYILPIHVTERVFAMEYVWQLESTDRHFHGQQKKSIFPSLHSHLREKHSMWHMIFCPFLALVTRVSGSMIQSM